MKKLSSLSLFVALAGLALMPTADSFAEPYAKSCNKCSPPTRTAGGRIRVECESCPKNMNLKNAAERLWSGNGGTRGKTFIECDVISKVNNCDGNLTCGPCVKDGAVTSGPYGKSCSGCTEMGGEVTCASCTNNLGVPSLFKTSVKCADYANVNNCGGKLRCGPCEINCGPVKMNICNGRTTCGPCKGTPENP